MATSIVIDAGHGGYDNGASYKDRAEKNDNLRLALRVGDLLEQRGYDVKYTRTDDVYQSPFEKSQIANRMKGDYFISFHRNSAAVPNLYQGVQSLVFSEKGDVSNNIGRQINKNLEELGFQNLGVDARPNLVVLRRTNMPAVLVETGFINSDEDNRLFDERFDEIANGIANGIEEAISPRPSEPPTRPLPEDIKPGERDAYEVQIGLFKYESNADYQAELARDAGFDARISYSAPYYAVRIPAGKGLEGATRLEGALRRAGFDTLIVTVKP